MLTAVMDMGASCNEDSPTTSVKGSGRHTSVWLVLVVLKAPTAQQAGVCQMKPTQAAFPIARRIYSGETCDGCQGWALHNWLTICLVLDNVDESLRSVLAPLDEDLHEGMISAGASTIGSAETSQGAF